MKGFILVLALWIVAIKAQKLPNPPTEFNGFALISGTIVNNSLFHIFYDQAQQRIRVDEYNSLTNNLLISSILLYPTSKRYNIDITTGACTVQQLELSWYSVWQFLSDATYNGQLRLPDGTYCSNWVWTEPFTHTMLQSCFKGNTPSIFIASNQHDNEVVFVAKFREGYPSNAFDVPAGCQGHISTTKAKSGAIRSVLDYLF